MTTRHQRLLEIAVVVAIGLALLAMLFPAQSRAKPAAYQTLCLNRVRLITVALNNYHQKYGAFPPSYLVDDAGTPIHSWRVLVLPYLDRQDLYEKYRFDEPWNGPHNSELQKEAAAWAADMFHCHEDPSDSSNTSYVAVVGPKTAWHGSTPSHLKMDFPDGIDQTLLVVESVGTGIHWMEPHDLEFDAMSFAIDDRQAQSIGGNHSCGEWSWNRTRCAVVGFVDGRVRSLPANTPIETVRSLLTANGAEHVEFPH